MYSIRHKRGLQANLPAVGNDGEIYIATDTGRVYRGTGSGMVEIAPAVVAGSGINVTGQTVSIATGTLPTGVTVDTANIIADSVTLDKLGAGALPTDITVASANIVDETITNSDISLTANITRSKLASGTASHVVINDGSGVMTSEAALSPTRGGTGQTSVTTGDILYSSASNVISKLPIGTSGQLLTVSGGVPTWQTGLTDPMTTAGDMVIRDGSNATARLPVGAANTVLTSNGTLPVYTQVTSAMIADGSVTDAKITGPVTGSKIQAASASVTGVITTGAQTVAGAKTFNGIVTMANGTASTSTTSGGLVVTSGLGVGGALFTGGRIRVTDTTAPTSGGETLTSISTAGGIFSAASIWTANNVGVGQSRLADGNASVVFQSVGGAPSVQATLARESGTNGNLNLTQTGTGDIRLLGGPVVTSVGAIEVGGARGSDGTSLIDFTTQVGADFNTRMIRDTGPNGTFVTTHNGTGAYRVNTANSASIELQRGGTDHIIIDGNGTAVRGRTAAVGAGYVGQELFSAYPTSAAVGASFGAYNAGAGIMDLNISSAGYWIISWRLRVTRTTAPNTIFALAGGLVLNGAVASMGPIQAGSYTWNRVGDSVKEGSIDADISGSVVCLITTPGNVQLQGCIQCVGGSTIIGDGSPEGTYIQAVRIA